MMSLVIAFCTYVWVWTHANVVTNTKEPIATSKAQKSRCLPVFRPPIIIQEQQPLAPGEGERMRGSKSGILSLAL